MQTIKDSNECKTLAVNKLEGIKEFENINNFMIEKREIF